MTGADQCPRCGSDDRYSLTIRGEPEHAVCRGCGTVWEPFDPAALANDGDAHGVFSATREYP